ncbi:MAG: MFS transporter [SAR86 cluster bacterium]|nr:MFS transporter [SAR86 cluster bacterium]
MKTWSESFLGFFKPKLLIILALGFCSGLPFGMLIDPLSYWLREADISRSTIGLLSWITLMFTFKALWSPFVDRIKLPFLSLLGQRKSWLVLSQSLVVISIFGMSFSDPTNSLMVLVAFALSVSFFAATQDICIDAMRVELVLDHEQGEAASMYQGGWRVAFLVSQVFTFFIASYYDWSAAYFSIGILMGMLVLFSIFVIPEPKRPDSDLPGIESNPLKSFKNLYLSPLKDLFERYFDNNILLVFLLIIFYRFSDIVLGPMAMPFYVDTGFSKEEVAIVTNAFGIAMTMAGVFVGGLLIYRYNLMAVVFLGALLVMLTNVAFAWLDTIGHNVSALTVTITLDNFSQGVASTALIALLSSLTNRSFTATQYAALFLLATFPATIIKGFSGFFVDSFGYFNFFLYAAALGIPAAVISYVLLKKKFAPSTS